MNPQKIEELFTYHNPQGIDPDRFSIIRQSAKDLAHAINEHGGEKQDVKRAILKLRECIFYAIASIVLPETDE